MPRRKKKKLTLRDRSQMFFEIQRSKYLHVARKENFTSPKEISRIDEIISEAWQRDVLPVAGKLNSMTLPQLKKFFQSIEVKFPIITDDNEFYEDIEDLEELEDLEYLDDLDDEMDFDDEFTEEDIDEIFEGIPEEEHENIAMLMLAMPALQAVGFPTEKFVATGDFTLTERQRKQVDWALELGYAIADMIDQEQQTRGKKKNNQAYTTVRAIAKKMLPESEVDNIVNEIITTYQRALRDMQ